MSGRQVYRAAWPGDESPRWVIARDRLTQKWVIGPPVQKLPSVLLVVCTEYDTAAEAFAAFARGAK